MKYICNFCNEIILNPKAGRPNKFCSRACHQSYRAANKIVAPPPKKCKRFECEILTQNALFCSRSCAATHNNSENPKRKLQPKKCSRCENIIDRSSHLETSVLCLSCRNDNTVFEKLTLGEVKRDGNSNWASRIPYIRSHARKALIRSGRPQECQACGYDIHVDCCHIKAIKDHSDDELISTINDPSNLLFLCKNHHWEFDNGLEEEVLAQID